MHSNKYIFIYSTVLVVLVAALLSATAMYLKPYQDKNVATEKMMSILSAAGIPSTVENANTLYTKYIQSELVVNEKGQIISLFSQGKLTKGDVRAFNMSNSETNSSIALPVFVCIKDADTLYILPIKGKGLWGAIWGNIALKSDFSTIAGVTFDHKGETPGLGAEISTKEFQQQFIGKKLMDAAHNYVSVAAVKGGVINQSKIKLENGVDAVSGGTITSAGLTKMMYEGLKQYLPFFLTNKGVTKITTPTQVEQKDTLKLKKEAPIITADSLNMEVLDTLKKEKKKEPADKEKTKAKKKKTRKKESDSTTTSIDAPLSIPSEIQPEESITPTEQIEEIKKIEEEVITPPVKKKKRKKESL